MQQGQRRSFSPPPPHKIRLSEPSARNGYGWAELNLAGTRSYQRMMIQDESETTTTKAMLDTPFYSQRLTPLNYQQEGFDSLEEASAWTQRICGLACLKMIIARITGDVVPLKTLLDQGLAVDGYIKGIGWVHQGLLDVASSYGITGLCQSIGTELDLIDAALQQRHLVMASVSCGFKPEKKGGHLVLIIGSQKGRFIVHHPSAEENEQWPHHVIDRRRFLKSFSVNGNIITLPLDQGGLERTG